MYFFNIFLLSFWRLVPKFLGLSFNLAEIVLLERSLLSEELPEDLLDQVQSKKHCNGRESGKGLGGGYREKKKKFASLLWI